MSSLWIKAVSPWRDRLRPLRRGVAPDREFAAITGGVYGPAPDVRRYMGRVAAAMWLAGAVVGSFYLVAFDIGATGGIVALALCVLGAVASVTLPWNKISRFWMLAQSAAAVGIIVMASLATGEQALVSFLLFVMIFHTAFFWQDRFVIFGALLTTSAALVLTVEHLGTGEDVREIYVRLPAFLAGALIIGLFADRLREVRLVERERFKATIEALSAALTARDYYTGEHSEHTFALVCDVCMHLGLDEAERQYVADVALLHDIGKIGIPNEILHFPGSLDEDQWAVMKKHPEIGERIVARVPGLEGVARAIRHEHERWDGQGYPDGLSGEQIPLASRIVFACDAFHAMVSDRPYRERMEPGLAHQEMLAGAGTQFDPAVVDALLQSLNRKSDGDNVVDMRRFERWSRRRKLGSVD